MMRPFWLRAREGSFWTSWESCCAVVSLPWVPTKRTASSSLATALFSSAPLSAVPFCTGPVSDLASTLGFSSTRSVPAGSVPFLDTGGGSRSLWSLPRCFAVSVVRSSKAMGHGTTPPRRPRVIRDVRQLPGLSSPAPARS